MTGTQMGLPFVSGSNTSEAAAKAASDEAPTLRRDVLKLIARTDDYGLTCDDVEVSMSRSHQTISARIRELAQGGLVEDSGRRRFTRSGRTARVYVATAAGKAAIKGDAR